MRRTVSAHTLDPGGVYQRKEARRERIEARIADRRRFGTLTDRPLDNVRWRGTWVGDCPDCGCRCVVGLGGKWEGVVPVECPKEACWYAEHYNYREAIDG